MIRSLEDKCQIVEESLYYINGQMSLEEENLLWKRYRKSISGIDEELQVRLAQLNERKGIASIFSCYGHSDRITTPHLILRVNTKWFESLFYDISSSLSSSLTIINYTMSNKFTVLTDDTGEYKALCIDLRGRTNYFTRQPEYLLPWQKERQEFWEFIDSIFGGY